MSMECPPDPPALAVCWGLKPSLGLLGPRKGSVPLSRSVCQLSSAPSCMAFSQEYLFIGGAKGFCIYHLFSGKRLYTWEKLKVGVTAVWAMDLDIETLLLLLDETGTVPSAWQSRVLTETGRSEVSIGCGG